MNKKLLALLLTLAMLLVAPICLAQSDHHEQIWLPPSWVFGSGYTPYDYPSSVGGWGYDPFTYYNYQGKTYHPYRYPYYYNPGSTWYPSYYQYDYYNPYTNRDYWYPNTYYGGYWWS